GRRRRKRSSPKKTSSSVWRSQRAPPRWMSLAPCGPSSLHALAKVRRDRRSLRESWLRGWVTGVVMTNLLEETGDWPPIFYGSMVWLDRGKVGTARKSGTDEMFNCARKNVVE